MGMSVILYSSSEAELAALESEPGQLSALLGAREPGAVAGRVELGKAWDALDVILSGRGKHPVLRDAVLGRGGRPLRAQGSFGPARVLTPGQAERVALALAALPADVVRHRYPELLGKDIHGNYGQETCAPDELKFIREKVQQVREREQGELEAALAALRGLYEEARKAGQGVMAIVV